MLLEKYLFFEVGKNIDIQYTYIVHTPVKLIQHLSTTNSALSNTRSVLDG